MSLLSRYYNKKYILRTLAQRNNDFEGLKSLAKDLENVNPNHSMLSTFQGSQESSTGFFYDAGSINKN